MRKRVEWMRKQTCLVGYDEDGIESANVIKLGELAHIADLLEHSIPVKPVVHDCCGLCGNCKAIVHPRQSFCPDCGVELDWEALFKELEEKA